MGEYTTHARAVDAVARMRAKARAIGARVSFSILQPVGPFSPFSSSQEPSE